MLILKKLVQNKIILSSVLALSLLFVVAPAKADATATDTFGLNQIDSNTNLGNAPIQTTVAKLINVAMSLLGVIAVVIILAGGFKWMTAGGNDEKVTEARKMIISGVVGLAVILSAWAIAIFVFKQLSNATGIKNTAVLGEGVGSNQ